MDEAFGTHNVTTDLRPLQAERGIALSREQVCRLVVQTPERLSLAAPAALCDILRCGPGELIEPVAAASMGPQATAQPGPRPARCGPGWEATVIPSPSPATSPATP